MSDNKISNSSTTSTNRENGNNNNILLVAAKRALGSGMSGGIAMALQVTSLMWMRTTMNYQYRNGTTTMESLKILYKEGGIRRFYRGYAAAMFQGPLSRFGDTAANVGILSYLDKHEMTKNLPIFAKTACASLTAALWRIFLMPIDATKTSLQVHGKDGFRKLTHKVRTNSVRVLWHGSLAAYSATLVGHFPWFFTFNTLDSKLPKWDNNIFSKLLRRAFMGFCASVVSDSCSNSIRVVKTFKQTSPVSISYVDAVAEIYRKSGLIGLFGRGLKTRILTNGAQGLMFAILWKSIQEMYDKKFE